MSNKIVQLTDDAFIDEVINAEQPVVVDFWGPNCGPCLMVGSILEELVNEMPEVKFCKIDVAEQQVHAIKYQILSIPTLLVIKNGEVVGKHVGGIAKEDLKAFISSSLKK